MTPATHQFPMFLLILLVMSASINFPCCSGKNGTICPETERQALLRFKQSIKDPLRELSSLNYTLVNCCTWKHVVCSTLTGHVLELQLQFSGIRGKLGDSLINLRHLKRLYLGHNHFEGTIPASIGSLVELEYLDLMDAGFTGNVPLALGNLSSLRSLVLTGPWPSSSMDMISFEWLYGLSRLEHLHIGDVNWVQVRNTLPSLLELALTNCSLSTFAPALNQAKFSSLNFVDLSSNSFKSLPIWIIQLHKITHLDLSGNSIPSVIGNLTSLNDHQISFLAKYQVRL